MNTRLAASVRAVEAKLEHVLEPEMRRALAAEWLGALDPERACEALSLVIVAEERATPLPDRLRDALFDLLSDPERSRRLGYEFRRATYAAAHRAGEASVMALLRSAMPADGDPGPRLPRDLADVPLGQRRTLAKGDDPSWLERLARDSDPLVISHLLRNPRLREEDVVRMAALRPVAVSTLLEVGRCDRWIRSPRVQSAVARNPRCPPELAVRLVARLPLPVLREMRADAGLHASTRAQVEHEIARRGGSGAGS